MRPFLIAMALLAPVIACSQQPNKSTRATSKTQVIQHNSTSSPYISYTIDPNSNFVYDATSQGSTETFANPGYTLIAGSNAANDKKVTLTLSGLSAKDALKKLFEEAGESYDLKDADLKDTTISLSVKDVRFTTALDLITQAAGVKYSIEMKDKKRIYHIGKSARSGVFFTDPAGANRLFFANPGSDLSFHLDRLVQPRANSLSTDLFTPLVYTSWLSEERSSFTCPHCKGQVTVLRHRQQPKCPKCGRAFSSDWQFCPADGTRRPAVSGTWKYCPICGKEVKMETSEKPKSTDTVKAGATQTVKEP